jgi:hypothetical protein
MCGISVAIVDPPPLPPEDDDPPKRCRVNMPEPFTFDEMMDSWGPSNLFSLLGSLSANMDTVYHEVSQRLANDVTGQLFQKWFGNVARNGLAELTTLAQQLGFAGGVMDAAYTNGMKARGGGGYFPKPIGGIKDLQRMWERGDKPRRDGDYDHEVPKDYRCYWVVVDDPGPGDLIGPISPGTYE